MKTPRAHTLGHNGTGKGSVEEQHTPQAHARGRHLILLRARPGALMANASSVVGAFV